MTISDDGIDIDFAGTSPISEFGINVPLTYTQAYASFGVRCVVGSTLDDREDGAVHANAEGKRHNCNQGKAWAAE
jgi:N-methylhydantoinase B